MMILRFLVSFAGPLGVFAIVGGAWLVAGWYTKRK